MAVATLLLCYGAFVLVSTHATKRYWDDLLLECLINLRKSWVVAGEPQAYNVADYHRSGDSFLHFDRDSTEYDVNGQTAKGLFEGKYAWRGRPVVFVIMQDGSVYERVGDRLVLRFGKRR